MKKPWKITGIMTLIYLSLGLAERGDPAKFLMNTGLFVGALAVVWIVYLIKSRAVGKDLND